MKKRIKVVQVCAIDETMDKLLKTLNERLIKDNYEVIGICSKGELGKNIIDTKVKLKNINIDRKIIVTSNIRSIYEMYKFLKKEKPEIVHVHTPMAGVLGRIAAKLANVPIIIYTAHGFYFHENMSKLKYNLFLNIEKFMGRNFTEYIFTQSVEDLEIANSCKFKKQNQMMAIGNGVDVSVRFNPSNINQHIKQELYDKLNIHKDDIVVTFIGRLVEEKGILDLLKSYNYIKNKVKFIIVGDKFQGDRDIHVNYEIDKYKNNENIKFVGKIPNVEEILSITDIFCLPSYREGMPRSIIEAMAMECAVIATNIRGSREEVLDGNTGFLVNLKSPNEIAKKIDVLSNDKKLLESMKQNARERALCLYNEEVVIKKQINVFKELLEKKGLI